MKSSMRVSMRWVGEVEVGGKKFVRAEAGWVRLRLGPSRWVG